MIDETGHSSTTDPPLLRAQLDSSPFAHLLVVLFEKRLSGTAVLQATSGESVQIAFESGQPLKALTSAEIARLGDVLVDVGHLTKPRLARLVTEMTVLRRLQGELLLEDGTLASEQLHEGLAEQLRRKVLYAAALPLDTSVAFYERIDLMAGWGGRDFVPIDPRPLVIQAVRAAPPWRQVHSALERIGDKSIHLSSKAELERYGLSPEQAAAARGLSTPTRANEWIEAGGQRANELRLLLYALLITKQVTVFDPAIHVRSRSPQGLSLSIAPAPASMPPPPVTEATPPSSRASSPPPRVGRPRIDDAEKHLEAQRVTAAEAVCREILAFEPKHADALAMLVWLEAIKPDNESAMSTERAIASLTRIVNNAPASYRAPFWRGLLYKRVGDPHAAARDFQRVVAIAPQHEAGNAELRFYRMRLQRGSLPPPKSAR